MAYTRVTKTRDGRAAIRYAFEEQKNKDEMDRVLMASGSNVDPKFAMMQMKAVWDRFGKGDGKAVQMYRIIQSFGLDELDPNNPEDIEKANNLGREFAEEMYPGRQSLIVTQADGKGGKLHNHVLVNSVSFMDGRSLRDDTKEFYPIARKTIEIMKRHGMNPPELPDALWDKTSVLQRKQEAAGDYVWQNDLRKQIAAGMNSPFVISQDSFVEHMRDEYGVGVRFRGTDKDEKGKKMKGVIGISYDFKDQNGKACVSRAYKLGRGYQVGGLNACIAANILDNAHAEALEDEAARVADAELLIDAAHAEALEDEALRVAEVQRLADEAAAKKSQKKVSGGFDFDSILGGDLAKLSKRFKPSDAPVRTSDYVEPDSVRIEREAKQAAEKAAAKMDELHGEALVVNDEVDADRSQEAAAAAREEAKRKAEQEKQKKDAENARKAIEAQEEARRQEQLKRAQMLRDEAKERIIQGVHYGQSSLYNTTDEELTEFMKNELKLTGKMMNSVTGKTPYTTAGIYRYTKNEIADRKRAERQGVDHATVQVAQDDGPEL